MRPTTLTRSFTIAHLLCLIMFVISLLGFGVMVITNTAPNFSYEIMLADTTGLEVHNGSACPRGMPSSACYWSGMAYEREFRIVYWAPGYRRELLSVKLPWER
ncbi:MAG TPA: hypothetical protein VKE41_13900 [Roseiflexaceae bacterium]|nr:hypothetical protein [Roseiflexaceae bacterium]